MERLRDAAVVGAGPAGLHAAYRLAAAGLDVALIEAQPRIGEGAICSGVVSEEAFRRFALPTRSVLTHIHHIQAISPAGQILEYGNNGSLARVVEKGEFNRALGERALATTVEIRLNQRVELLEHDKHCVTLHLSSREGLKDSLRARLAVIASGVNCSLNRTLGLARPWQLLRAMQAEVTAPAECGSLPTKVYVGRGVAPGAFAWEIPLGNGKVRLGVMTTENPKPYFRALLRRVSPQTSESSVTVRQKAIAQAPVGRCVADRILVIGEAAGHVKTSTGGGIYYGLLSADFASEVALRAFRKGDLSAPALADFERYWRTAFGGELLVGFLARGLASCFPDELIESLFRLANSRRLLARLDGNLKFDWHRKALLATLSSLLTVASRLGGRPKL